MEFITPTAHHAVDPSAYPTTRSFSPQGKQVPSPLVGEGGRRQSCSAQELLTTHMRSSGRMIRWAEARQRQVPSPLVGEGGRRPDEGATRRRCAIQEEGRSSSARRHGVTSRSMSSPYLPGVGTCRTAQANAPSSACGTFSPVGEKELARRAGRHPGESCAAHVARATRCAEQEVARRRG